MGGRGSSGRAGGAGASAPTESREQILAKIKSVKAPKRGFPTEVTANGKTAVISRVTAGYQYAGTSNTMYSIAVYDRNGEEVFRTNRRGSNAMSQIRDDLKIHFGVKR